jgi:hypothetical protein
MSSTFDLLESNQQRENEGKVKYPDGISDANASGSAYKAIIELAEEKRRYIKAHSKKTAYRSAKTYLVQRSEVSTKAVTKVQTLFNTSTYAENLKKALNEVNDELEKLKEERLTIQVKRTKQQSKSVIYLENQQLKKEIKELKQKNAIEHIDALINKMSLKARKIMLL